MSFELQELNGYKKGKRYEKKLKCLNVFGNSKTRYVTLEDEEGNRLSWTTNDYTKVYQNFKNRGVYRFTVDYIVRSDKQICITRMRLVKNRKY